MVDGERQPQPLGPLQRAVIAVVTVAAVLSVPAMASAQQSEPPTTTESSTTEQPTPPTRPTTTRTPTTAPTTTATPTTAPTTQATVPPPPPPTEAPTSTADDEGDVDEEVAAADVPVTEAAQSLTVNTVANVLVEGDGTPGAESTTTTAAVASGGSGADDESRLIWMVIAGLGGLAVLVAVLTWRYWLLTRPGLDVDDDEAEDDGVPPGRPVAGPARPRRAGQG
ncbi:MAG TPA: hypothetical protein VF743_12155, partial [Acidimicrobiales bacterium]